MHLPSCRRTLTGHWSLRRWSRVNRPWAGLWRNHSALRDNRLARCWFGRRSRSGWRTGRCLWWRSRSFRLSWRRRYCCCWRMRGRSNNHRRRRSWFFRRRWRRNYRRGLPRRRRDYSALFRLRRSRFRCNNRRGLLCGRSWKRGRRCRFYRSRYCGLCRSCGCRSRRPRRSCGKLLLLLSFSQLPGYIAGLGNLGEIDLRLYICGSRPLFCGRAGFC